MLSRPSVVALAGTILGTVGLPAAAAADPLVPDPALARCFAEALPGVDPLTPESLGTLTALDCSERGVASLEGLQHATAVRSLTIVGGSLTDLSPIADLPDLQHLNVQRTEVADISDVAGLTGLTELELSFNKIVDITPVAGLSDLTRLGLTQNDVRDVSPLAGLTGLTWLSLGNSTYVAEYYERATQEPAPSDLMEMAAWPARNVVSDFTALRSLSALEYLNVSDLGITDLDLLVPYLPASVQVVDANSNGIADLTPLSHAHVTRGRIEVALAMQDVRLESVTVGEPVSSPVLDPRGMSVPLVVRDERAVLTGEGWILPEIGDYAIDWEWSLIGGNSVPLPVNTAATSAAVQVPAAVGEPGSTLVLVPEFDGTVHQAAVEPAPVDPGDPGEPGEPGEPNSVLPGDPTPETADPTDPAPAPGLAPSESIQTATEDRQQATVVRSGVLAATGIPVGVAVALGGLLVALGTAAVTIRRRAHGG